MTDPRITDCAKALKLKAREIGLPVALTADQAADLARACVLKWLAQNLSEPLLAAMSERIDLIRKVADPSGIMAASLFNLMAVQAIKEIG